MHRATRSAPSGAFSAFVENAASAGVAASDVLVNANGLSLYVLSPGALALVDLRHAWASAPLANVTSAPADGTAFLGVALAPR